MTDPIKNIMVCLDNSDTNEDLLTFARFIVKNNKSVKRVIGINILKNFHLPPEVVEEFPELEKNAISERAEKLKKLLENHLGDKKVERNVIIHAGSAVKTFLKVIENESIDLVLIGKKPSKEGFGILTQRMGRRCPVTLLIVPKGSSKKIAEGDIQRKILVPVDFSKYSTLAMERAADIANNNENTEIHALHVYHVPTGYHYAGKTPKQFAAIMKKHAEEQFKKFIIKGNFQDVTIQEKYILDKEGNIVNDIHDYAKKINATGIIFGSKGMTTASSYFLGSTAEKMIKIDTDFPLMVVRKAGDYKGFMHMIQKL